MLNMKSNYNGIIVINKPKSLTSRDVVNKVSKILQTKKIGHTGTLDPIATGILILTLGSYTKLSNLITGAYKTYTVEAKLGYETDTLDITGKITKTSDIHPESKDIIDVINSFIGEYEQVVPAYSAVKINGKKLYQYARSNEQIELPKRTVTIKSITNIVVQDNYIKFTCIVSKGTYIRSLIRDIGNKLGTYATMTSLNRDSQSNFTMDDTVTLKQIQNNDFTLYKVKDIFKNIHIINCDDELYKQIYNGVVQHLNISDNYILYTYIQKEIALYKKDNDAYRMYVKLDK